VLTIRHAQMRSLSRSLLDEFVERAFVVIRKHWRHKVERLGPAATRETIYRGILQAFGYGLEVEQQVMRFLNVLFALGEGFPDTYPWAARVLNNTRLKPDMKIELLLERTRIFLDGSEVD
jgi:hypothetical protein